MDRYLFLALVAALPIAQPSLGALGGYPVLVTDVLFVAIAGFFAIGVAAGTETFIWSRWYAPVAAFVAAGLLSAAASSDSHATILRAAGTGYLAALALLGAHYGRDEQMRKSIVMAWMAGTVATLAASATGVALFFAGRTDNRFLYGFGSLPAGSYPRVQGLFVNANMLCTYLAASVFMIMAAGRAGLVDRRITRPLTLAIIAVAVLTLSPGLGGLALALSLWWSADAAAPRARRIRLAGAAAAMLFVLATLGSPTMLLRDDVPGVDFKPSSRVLAWEDAALTFAAHPLLGAGPGAAVAHVNYVNASRGSELLTDAHNTWLSVLGQYGLLGFTAFAAIIAMLVARMRFPVVITPASAWRTGCELALVAALLYPSLSGSFEDTRHIWLLLGLTHAAQRQTVKAREISLQTAA